MSYTLRMKELRKNRKLTQNQLAMMIGETDRVVGAWERGETALPLDSAYKIAIALGCSVNDLCGWPKGKNEGRVFEDDFEEELLRCYRESTPDRQDRILETARDAAGMSKKWPNVICLKPSSIRHRRR